MIVGYYVLITLLLSGLYVFLLINVLQGWSKIPDHQFPKTAMPILDLSILIPARNEESHITQCLDSVLRNVIKSPHHIQIIVIDDHSDDKTAELAKQYLDRGVQLLYLEDYLKDTKVNAYKKSALAYGLTIARGTYIIQIDADVLLSDNYLAQVSSAIINTGADFIAAPVIFLPQQSLLGHFQCLDMLGMMTLTGAGIKEKKWYLANGANMIYKKEHANFSESELASGDDIYTIQNIAAKAKAKICFLRTKEAAVYTPAEQTYSSFWKQRIRWATKNKRMSNSKMLYMMVIPFLNACWLVLHFFFLINGGPIILVVGAFHLCTLMAIDYIYLKAAATYYDQERSLKYFIPSFFYHKMYLAIIGIASFFITKYEWKERVVR